MALDPGTFRAAAKFIKIARTSTLMATAFGASALLGFPAFAENSKAPANGGVTATTNCSTYRPDIINGSTLCEYYKGELAKKQRELAKKEGKALDQSIAGQKKENSDLEKGILSEKIIGDCLSRLSKFQGEDPKGFLKLGEITRKNVCEVAARIPPPLTGRADHP